MEGTAGAAGGPGERPAREPIRVLVAADPLVREALRHRFQEAPEVALVGEAEGCEAAVRRARELRPDVLLFDPPTPRGGADAARALRAAAPQVRLVVLSGAVSGLQARILAGLGVSGYLAKAATTGELLRALRAAHAGGTYFEPTVVGMLLPRPGAPTDRELTVLQLAADGARYREIARRLAISERTVRFHLENLRRKGGLLSRDELVRLARQRGWIG